MCIKCISMDSDEYIWAVSSDDFAQILKRKKVKAADKAEEETEVT